MKLSQEVGSPFPYIPPPSGARRVLGTGWDGCYVEGGHSPLSEAAVWCYTLHPAHMALPCASPRCRIGVLASPAFTLYF